MDEINKRKLVSSIKERQKQYLEKLANQEYNSEFTNRFKNLSIKIRKLLRKEYASENSIKIIPTISRILFGLIEDIKQKHAINYDFCEEKKVVNKYLINYLDYKISSNYDKKVPSYGETLLNAYLDLFITATVFNTDKETSAHPYFLVNPKTKSKLEIDVLFEDLHIAFEFQGEHHYTNSKTLDKDQFKLTECHEKETVLIPVNPSQLNCNTLQELIVNSIKNFLQLNELFEDKRPEHLAHVEIGKIQLLKFSKVVQRLYLSNIIFSESIEWLDTKSNEYINKSKEKYPISANKPAPRYLFNNDDISLENMYKNLKYVRQLRKIK